MEPLCGPMQILLCEDMFELIQNDFRFADLGEHEVQGFGVKRIYRLEGADDVANDLPSLS